MNQFQKRHHRQESRLAATGYIPAADCIGKTFVFGSCHYEVIAYNSERFSFTLSIINHGNAHIEKDETFVRHHCTPPTPREITPCRYEAPRYFPFPSLTISDKTQLDAPVAEHQAKSGSDKMTDTELADVQLNTTFAGTDVNNVTFVGADAEAHTGVHHNAPLDPAYYLDQEFTFKVNGTTYHAKVQAWNEHRQQFRLYAPGGAPWYRDPAFVHAHCQPAAAPVVRKPLPELPKINPRRFWYLMSLTDKRQYIAEDVQATGIPQADPLLQCNCCGQHVTIIGKQVWSAKMNREDSILVECRNEDCIARRRTATTESHHQICEDALREAEQCLKKEQIQYAHARSQHWLDRLNRLQQNGKGHIKSARAAQRKSTYWLNQLDKLEASANG